MDEIKDKEIYSRFRISQENLEFIHDFAERKKIARNSPHKALDYILNDYRDLDLQRFDLRFVANELKNDLLEEVRSAIKNEVAIEMKRIRLGTNNTDRNTQILIELLQGFIVAMNPSTLTTTEEFRPTFLKEAEKVVQERINNLMLKKRSYTERNN